MQGTEGEEVDFRVDVRMKGGMIDDALCASRSRGVKLNYSAQDNECLDIPTHSKIFRPGKMIGYTAETGRYRFPDGGGDSGSGSSGRGQAMEEL